MGVDLLLFLKLWMLLSSLPILLHLCFNYIFEISFLKSHCGESCEDVHSKTIKKG